MGVTACNFEFDIPAMHALTRCFKPCSAHMRFSHAATAGSWRTSSHDRRWRLIYAPKGAIQASPCLECQVESESFCIVCHRHDFASAARPFVPGAGLKLTQITNAQTHGALAVECDHTLPRVTSTFSVRDVARCAGRRDVQIIRRRPAYRLQVRSRSLSCWQ